MRYVVGMETSGRTRDALIALGHEAISVDLLPAQVPGFHHQGDVFAFLEADSRFVFGLFHPDCTYHTVSAAWAFKDPDFERYPGVGYHQRVKPETKTGEARRVARELAEADVRRVRYLPIRKVIENPRGTLGRVLGAPHDMVQPYEFGSDASKATCLWWFDENGDPMPHRLPRDPAAWVKPRLWCPSCRQCSLYDAAFGYGCVHCGGEAGRLMPRWANQTDSGQNRDSPAEKRWQVRSDTYPGIAAAIAKQIVSEGQIG